MLSAPAHDAAFARLIHNSGPPAQPAIMARPSLYKPEFARQAGMLCRLGADYQELAQVFRVSQATIYRWLDQRTDFAAATAHGRARYESPVGRSRYQRAIGGDYIVERVFHFRGREPVAARYRRRILADPKAALCWLRARRPEEWRIGYRAHLKGSGQVSSSDLVRRRVDAPCNESTNEPIRPNRQGLKSDSHNLRVVNRVEAHLPAPTLLPGDNAKARRVDWIVRNTVPRRSSAVESGWYVGSQNRISTLRITCREPLLLGVGQDLFTSLGLSATAGLPRSRIPAILRAKQMDCEVVLHHPPPATAAHTFASPIDEAGMPARPDMVPGRTPEELPKVHRESPIRRLSDTLTPHSTMKRNMALTLA